MLAMTIGYAGVERCELRLAISATAGQHILLLSEKRAFSSQLSSYLLRFAPRGADTLVCLFVIIVVDNGFGYVTEEARLLAVGRFLLFFKVVKDVEQRFEFRHFACLLFR